MCFWIRISGPFHLNTLDIPIQNIKCPKTHVQTSFSPQPLFVKLELCRLYASMPNPICVTGSAILHESHYSVRCFVLGYVFKDDSDYRVLIFLPQSMKCASMCFTHHHSFISEPATEGFLMFLGHLIFWMGMFKVFRWKGLEILIPKHTWKSIIQFSLSIITNRFTRG